MYISSLLVMYTRDDVSLYATRPYCLRTSSFKLLVPFSRSAAKRAAPAAFVNEKKIFSTGTTCSSSAAVPIPLCSIQLANDGSTTLGFV